MKASELIRKYGLARYVFASGMVGQAETITPDNVNCPICLASALILGNGMSLGEYLKCEDVPPKLVPVFEKVLTAAVGHPGHDDYDSPDVYNLSGQIYNWSDTHTQEEVIELLESVGE